MIQRSRSTGGHVFYPRIVEPGTGADDLEWVEASGKGVVHAVTVVRKKDPADSYNVVLVDLAEGPRLMSRIDGADVDAVRIGMDVAARIVQEGTSRCSSSCRHEHEPWFPARAHRDRRRRHLRHRQVPRRLGRRHGRARGDAGARRCRPVAGRRRRALHLGAL
ncbi:Zn-ribbon domain-containing OB-fold protein [Rhizorhabdus histidinilytica]